MCTDVINIGPSKNYGMIFSWYLGHFCRQSLSLVLVISLSEDGWTLFESTGHRLQDRIQYSTAQHAGCVPTRPNHTHDMPKSHTTEWTCHNIPQRTTMYRSSNGKPLILQQALLPTGEPRLLHQAIFRNNGIGESLSDGWDTTTAYLVIS